MAVGHRPDDVLGAEGGVAAEEHVGARRLEGRLVDDRHAPLVEIEADVALDPRESVLLAHGDEHVVAFEGLVGLAGGDEAAPPLLVADRLHLLEDHAGEAPLAVQEGLGHEEVQDRDAFVRRVLLLPRARLHLLEARAHDHLHVLAAQAARRAAAIHRGVAPAQHDHALADLRDVAERHRREPVDADVDIGRGLFPSRDVEVAPARRARADEHRVEALAEERLQRIDAVAGAEVDAQVEDVSRLLVDHRFRQAELGNLRADHAAREAVGIEKGDVVAERREITRDREGRGARPHAGDALAVHARGLLRQAVADVFLEVGRDALQAADGDRLGLLALVLLDAAAAAGGLAGTIARAPEDPGKHVRLPVDHVRIAVTALRDETDVFGNRRVRGTRPLAVDDFVEIGRIADIGRFQLVSPSIRSSLSESLFRGRVTQSTQ